MIKKFDFGFAFSRVLAFYGFASPKVVRRMPLETFWMLNKNIDRISAERDQRMALVQIRSQSSEGVSDMMTDLRKQMGVTVQLEAPRDAKLDRNALHRLSAIGDMTNHAYPG